MTTLPWTTIKNLSIQIGPLPSGDAPAAWFMSLDQEVISGYEKWKSDHKAWRDRLTELMEISGIKTEDVYYGGHGLRYLIGLYVDGDPPPGWRRDKKGYIVPRKRTVSEKKGEIVTRFRDVERIPDAIDYIPGMPDALYLPGKDSGTRRVFWPVVRRFGQAVLVFWGADPLRSIYPFVPDPRWSQLGLSIFHALRESQDA